MAFIGLFMIHPSDIHRQTRRYHRGKSVIRFSSRTGFRGRTITSGSSIRIKRIATGWRGEFRLQQVNVAKRPCYWNERRSWTSWFPLKHLIHRRTYRLPFVAERMLSSLGVLQRKATTHRSSWKFSAYQTINTPTKRFWLTTTRFNIRWKTWHRERHIKSKLIQSLMERNPLLIPAGTLQRVSYESTRRWLPASFK